ncbi:preprotein translocase, SecE subunit [Desulfofarcimen acetoxidans DSM 771]|jgi:preprotein translocase subunit SecE|uniref:Protein translocase subunit SecE n=1 Tax=Desulfofarcimen acetoxidans (strain ATCC 49208 / DSM 771 / KCTC 5769 / VKM B-1644 / 5575) TaxID=485916 RepID=C8W3X1_DESAS|nr:preprotein translocase subunit SecE [Desulfofarcimen acetoxidans]ACV61225.1 preprotein translocase, SecE subunit [Desulfofarcimen acetoxidans DSM 771]
MALSKNDTKKKGAVKKLKVDTLAKAAPQEEPKKISLKNMNFLSRDAIKKRLPVKRDGVKGNRIESLQKFFKGVYNELKKVHWPNRREIAIYTLVVLVSVVFVAVLIWVFDSALSQLLKLILPA